MEVIQDTSFTDTKVESGVRYTYAVASQNATDLSQSDRSESLSITYLAIPRMTSAEPINGGIKIIWEETPGAVKYWVYRRQGRDSMWSALGETTRTMVLDDTGVVGRQYYYSVRAISSMDESGNASGYADTGIATVYYELATPELSYVGTDFGVNSGVKLTWNPVTNAVKYQVSRKADFEDLGRVLGETANGNFNDTTAVSSYTYTYTVRCIDADGNYISKESAGKTYWHLGPPSFKSATNDDGGGCWSGTRQPENLVPDMHIWLIAVVTFFNTKFCATRMVWKKGVF